MAGKTNHVSDTKTVREVFNGRSILVTGVTGFVGKVLLEKLMRCCEIELIYVVIRPQKTDDARQRLNKLFEEKVFDRVRRECKEKFSRVLPLSGDVTIPDCGLNPSDLETVFNEVSVVFHCAASVRFDEDIRKSVAANVDGVRNILDLCHKISDLEGLIHVSTAYAFCNWEEIHEEVYPENLKPEDLLGVCKWIGDEELLRIFECVRSGRPSIYHFTKAIAENLLHKERQNIPLCIVRPSIVTAAWKDPFPGWIDTYNGPSGLIVACGKGVIKSVHVNPEIIADFIPVDVVANTIIASAWSCLINKPTIMVVNCTSNKVNPLTWGDVETAVLPLLYKYPSMGLYRYPGGSFKKSYYRHKLSVFIHHIIPAYIVQTLSWLAFKPLRLVKMYQRIHNVMSHLEYFTTNQFDFHCPNYISLMKELNEADAQVFSVDIRQLNWTEYFENYVLGVRRYLLKEDDETIPSARKRMYRIYYMSLAAKLSGLIACILMLHRYSYRVPPVFKSAYSTLSSNLEHKLSYLHGNVTKYFK